MAESYNSLERRMQRLETMVYLLCMHLGLDPRTGRQLTPEEQMAFDNRPIRDPHA